MKSIKKRLYFILSGENLFHPYYFSKTIEQLNKSEYQVVGVSIALERYKKGFFNFLSEQLQLWGVNGFAFIAFSTTLFNMLEAIGLKIYPSTINIAKQNRIPVTHIKNVNNEKHLKYLKQKNIDIIISSNGQIFKKELLKIPKVASINRHTALLPKYGGVLPVFWAMYHNEKKFGVSVHYMVENIDEGDILHQHLIPLKQGNSMFRNYISAFEIGAKVTIQALNNIRDKKIFSKFSKKSKKYFSAPSSEQVKDFRKRYHSFRIKDISLFFNTFIIKTNTTKRVNKIF